ncbi:ApbE Membrane-associated lipoprotein involved in thiamine biosynthesis [Methylophilaceae bacterium]|jgi:thiamine biosynthesis lipoprotein
MRLLSILAFCLLLTSCSRPEPIHNTQSYVFGTLVDITIYGETEEVAQELSGEIIRDFQELHNRLHAWRASEINTLNIAFKRNNLPATVRPDVAAIISDATALSIQSKGAFNPAIGALINYWGFQSDELKPVQIDDLKIKELLSHNPQMIDISIKNGKAASTNPHVQLDLGGYVKGFALDSALQTLRQHGVRNALINVGGNIIALGQHGDKPWRVGIQHPRKPSAIATLDLESGWSIGTSGDYQRYFILKDKRYCHIIDPATGYPVTGVQAVTVLIPPQANAGTLSDVASKPIFIAQPNLRAEVAKEMNVENFMVIESDVKIITSSAMAKRITWTDVATAKYVTQIQL